MRDESIPVVVIIGSGFCGMMTAVNLFQSPVPLKIVIINEGYPFGKGVAYSAYSEKYLLNMRAINMSAYADMPQHFLDWVCALDKYSGVPKSIMTNAYVPRKIYGDYLSSVWSHALQIKNEWMHVECINAKAIDINAYTDH